MPYAKFVAAIPRGTATLRLQMLMSTMSLLQESRDFEWRRGRRSKGGADTDHSLGQAICHGSETRAVKAASLGIIPPGTALKPVSFVQTAKEPKNYVTQRIRI